MPSWFTPSYRDTKRWLECRRKAAAAMIAEGWNKHARKFDMVLNKRAAKLYKGA